MTQFILKITCADRPGIVAGVAQCIAGQGGNIIESAQYSDQTTGTFFMRIAFAPAPDVSIEAMRAAFEPIAEQFAFDWQILDAEQKIRAAIMVSKGGHCLNDLLYRVSTGRLPMKVTSVISNHRTWQRRAEHDEIPYHYVPMTSETKAAQKATLIALLEEQQVDLIILARYMQVLSHDICSQYSGRIINIHHSFLPSFKGANPYHRAYARGVKMVGATAHYVTGELDEGPIIAQDVSMVDHADSVDDLIAQGQDIESRVLARAVKAHIEQRVILNGNRTVVFK